MHELSIAQNMIEEIERQAPLNGFTRVLGVTLEIGSLSHVEVDAMKFCFDSAVMDTIAEGASLQIQKVPAIALCKQCNTEQTIEARYDCCSSCGEFGLEVLSGEKVSIKALEVS